MAKGIFSRGSDGTYTRSGGPGFIIGRVKKIVLGPENFDGSPNEDYKNPSDVGKIFYEVMYSNLNLSKASFSTRPAYPIFNFVKQYPLISEIVMIVPGPDSNLNDSIDSQGYYYFPPYSLWSSGNHNAFPNMEEYAEYVSEFYTKPEFAGRDPKEMPKLPLGYTFAENENIKQLRVFEGDTILESRFGQSIRFGSTVAGSKNLNPWSNSENAGSPITIIRNGQKPLDSSDTFQTVTEDFNRDDASIWLTSGQELSIENIEKFPLRTFNRNRSIANNQAVKKTVNTSLTTSTYSRSAAQQDNDSMS